MRLYQGKAFDMAYQVDDFADPWCPHDTVVLLPGFCRNTRFWRAWVPTLATDFRVIRVDLPGCADSPPLPQDVELTFDEIVDEVHDFVGFVAPEGAHLIGESSGGLLGALLTADDPAVVRSLTMLSTPLGVGRRTTGPHSLGHADWPEALRTLGMHDWWLRSRRETVGVPVNEPRDEHWAAEFARTPVDTAIKYVGAVSGRTVTDIVKDIPVPTLVIRPEHSPFMDAKDEQTWQQIPDVRVRTYPLNNDMYYLVPGPLIADCHRFLTSVADHIGFVLC
jgi:pimeloyl-ACP methyl ester carboxylesterase